MWQIFFIFSLCVGSVFGANHLTGESSPYLLQHKNNPVDWYPWGDAAFAKAKKEGKLIFLSIGYSTCHWCHVMAEESFEDTQVAKILNKYYVSIKVDREQYPHIDKYYQNVYRSLHHKGGGWPLSIILSSDRKPLFAGTYIPKYGGYGSKYGLLELLTQMKDLTFKQRQAQVASVAKYLHTKHTTHTQPLHNGLLTKMVQQLQTHYDRRYKGFYTAPKFPHATTITALLELYRVENNTQALVMAQESLEAMARGGIYDQIGGGFFRYSVDRAWKIPHFEKMLYTNAELIKSYTQGYILTGNPLFKKVSIETIKEIEKWYRYGKVYMSASNADSQNFEGENEEGFYFTYLYDDVVTYLKQEGFPQKSIEQNLRYLGIEEDGNVDGEVSLAHITQDLPPQEIDKVKKALLHLRQKRSYPFRDKKINLAWNALYLDAKLKASELEPHYKQEVLDSLDALIEQFYRDGVLYHQTIENQAPKQKGLLEDYAFFAQVLFDAYEFSLEERYFQLFKTLTQQSVALFYKKGRWLMATDGFEQEADLADGAYANPLAQTLINLEILATLEAKEELFTLIQKTLQNYGVKINHYPSSYATLTKLILMQQYGVVFVKSTQENLAKITLPTTRYLYIYKKATHHDVFVACKRGSCFAYGKRYQEFKKALE
jgi:uncharacterized protein YyaL (SSP411 family)